MKGILIRFYTCNNTVYTLSFYTCNNNVFTLSFYTCNNNVFTLSIGTLTILVLKSEIVLSTCTISWCVRNIAVCMANLVDLDQRHFVMSDQGLHCLQRSVPIHRVIMVALKHPFLVTGSNVFLFVKRSSIL